MPSILLSISVLFTLTLAWTAYCSYYLYINYLQARKMGIPIRIIPIDHLNKFWLLVDKKIVALIRRLPGKLGNNNFTRFNYRGWHEHDRTRAHDEMGDAFVLVTPSHNWVYIADPDTLMNVYRRGKDFPRWVEITQMLDVFGGPNIATASGEKWKAHRKVVQSSLNERCNAIVWSEAALLGDQMAQHWASKGIFTSIGEDVRTVSLNILCRACFGQSYSFQGHNDSTTTTSSPESFRSSLVTIMENALIILALRPRFFTNPWFPLPEAGKRLSTACITFQNHMATLYNQKIRALRDNELSGDSTMLASLARASQNKEEGKPLTESEIYGTMFVVSFAGHDTTSHLLTYAIFYLAANPSVQDWLSQEMRQVLGHKPSKEWDYHADFPRLKRCMAILFETLRVKTLVPEVKWTSDRPQSLDIKGRTLVIPPKTLVIPSYIHVHNSPQIWGADADKWRPTRWIAKNISNGPGLDSISGDDCSGEILLQPPSRGSYLGWSEGARDCPGKRFSQVEWVAVMAALFRDWKVEPCRQGGENFTESRSRVLDFIDKSTDYGGLLLQLMNPERVPLVWSPRS